MHIEVELRSPAHPSGYKPHKSDYLEAMRIIERQVPAETGWYVWDFLIEHEAFRIYADGKVVLSAEWYEAASAFWDIVKTMVPQGYSLEVKKEL